MAVPVVHPGGCSGVTLSVGDQPLVGLTDEPAVTAAIWRIFGSGIPARYGPTAG